MAITVTEKAARHIQKALARQGGLGLRFGVKKVGCSGLAYTFDYAKETGDDDQVFRCGDVTVVVDKESLPYVDGSVLDFVREGLNESFDVKNPKATAQCGCGESFTINPDVVVRG
jgi:iron-sulfur cluster assembly protein